jgi:hypothetical protein
MAASAFTIFKTAKGFIGDGTIDLDTDAFKIAFFTSATTLSAGIASTYTQLNSVATQVAAAGGYPAGGESLTSVVWTTGTSAGQHKFDAADYVLTASGSQIVNIRYAVVHEVGSGKLLCYAALTTAQFTLAAGNTLTVTMPAAGVFTLA